MKENEWEERTNIVLWEDRKLRVRSNFNWRGHPEEEGWQIGHCKPIGPKDPSQASKYVPVKWDKGYESFIHKDKIIYLDEDQIPDKKTNQKSG